MLNKKKKKKKVYVPAWKPSCLLVHCPWLSPEVHALVTIIISILLAPGYDSLCSLFLNCISLCFGPICTSFLNLGESAPSVSAQIQIRYLQVRRDAWYKVQFSL